MKIALTGLACILGLTISAQTASADQPTRHTVCLNAGDIDHNSYPDDHTILFHMKGGKVRIWRNDLPHACPGLKVEQGVAMEIHGGTICSNAQIVYVLRRWTPCVLGRFTPVEVRGQPPMR